MPNLTNDPQRTLAALAHAAAKHWRLVNCRETISLSQWSKIGRAHVATCRL